MQLRDDGHLRSDCMGGKDEKWLCYESKLKAELIRVADRLVEECERKETVCQPRVSHTHH